MEDIEGTESDIKDRAIEKWEQVKWHFRHHRGIYISAGAVVLAGAGGVLIGRNLTPKTGAQVVQGIKLFAVGWGNHQTAINFAERSTPSKPLHLVGTHQYFDSVSDAARQTGEWRSRISQNVNGHIPHVHGKIFEVVDLPASSQE